METAEILSKLKHAVPGGIVLEKSRFGRSEAVCVWIDSKAIAEVAAFLASDAEISLDWLENLSAMQVDEALVLTYFARSSARAHSLILRVSVVPASANAEAECPSVARAWPMGMPMEAEAAELFGIRFTGTGAAPRARGTGAHGRLLPEGWVGFPLRKSYVFPQAFGGVPHTRPANRGRGDSARGRRGEA